MLTLTSRRVVIAVILALVAGLAGQNTASAVTAGVTIGIDNVHGPIPQSILGSGTDFETFRSVITGKGHTIELLTSFEAADLAGVDAVFLTNDYTVNAAPYSASEIAAIQALATQRVVLLSDTTLWSDVDAFNDRSIAFGDNQKLLENIIDYISAGNAAVFMADGAHDGVQWMSDTVNFNDLVAPYGVVYPEAAVDSAGHTVAAGIVPHPVTAGVGTIGVDFQRPMTLGAPALDLTVGSGSDNVLAVLIPEPATLALLAVGGAVSLARKRRRTAG